MTSSYVPAHSSVERIVKENIAAMDEAIVHLRKAGMVETADKLGGIRDYLARSDAYFRRIESGLEKRADRTDNFGRSRAERLWLDATGRRAK